MLLRVVLAGGFNLVHQGVALARYSTESIGEHGRGGVVDFRGFKEADAAIVSVADESGEVLLSDGSETGWCAKGEARDLEAGASERCQAGGGFSLGGQGQAGRANCNSGGEAGLEDLATRVGALRGSSVGKGSAMGLLR